MELTAVNTAPTTPIHAPPAATVRQTSPQETSPKKPAVFAVRKMTSAAINADQVLVHMSNQNFSSPAHFFGYCQGLYVFGVSSPAVMRVLNHK